MTYSTLLFSIVIMFLPSIAANSLALYCIIPDLKKRKTLVKQLLFTLSMVDMFGATGVTNFQLFNAMGWISPAICSVTCFLAVYFTILSGATATFMATERCIALKAPYWYQKYMLTWKIWMPFAGGVFIITIVCFLPQMGFGDMFLMRRSGNISSVMCGSFPYTMVLSKKAVFSVAYGLLGLVLVVINLSCNTAVLLTLHTMTNRILPSQRAPGGTYQEFEMTKMLLALSACFLICWVPMNVELVMVHAGWVNIIPGVNIFTQTLVGFNFVLDPIIYLILMRKYRDRIKALICCRKPRSDTEITDSAVNTLHNPALQLTDTSSRRLGQ